MTSLLSSCCRSPVRVAGTDEGTHWHECEKCGKACDVCGIELTKGEPMSEKSVAQPPPTHYYPLFEHMSHAHNLTLLDSELEDIVQIIKGMKNHETHLPG